MALALRLRRALVSASTSASLLRPAASTSASLLPATFAPSLPRRFLPGGAGGFRSTAAAAARGNYGGGADDSRIDPEEILFVGCDYKPWLITMEFPDAKPSREEMIETYLQTLAKVEPQFSLESQFPSEMRELVRNWACLRVQLDSRGWIAILKFKRRLRRECMLLVRQRMLVLKLK